ncbi:MAG: thiamine phosphate synthase [Hyphomicrobiales bacterium]
MNISHVDSKKGLFNQSLYVIIENDYSSQNIRHKSLAIANAIVTEGCDIIQYRAQGISYYKMLDEAKSIAQICNQNNIPFIINNHIDLAIDVSADGVHLNREDVSVTQTRVIMGNRKIIGLSIRTLNDAKNAQINALDYVTIEGIFPTNQNLEDPKPILNEDLADIVQVLKSRAPDLPIIGNGGLCETNVGLAMKQNIDSISVTRAIAQAKKPAVAVKKLKKAMLKTLKT